MKRWWLGFCICILLVCITACELTNGKHITVINTTDQPVIVSSAYLSPDEVTVPANGSAVLSFSFSWGGNNTPMLYKEGRYFTSYEVFPLDGGTYELEPTRGVLFIENKTGIDLDHPTFHVSDSHYTESCVEDSDGNNLRDLVLLNGQTGRIDFDSYYTCGQSGTLSFSAAIGEGHGTINLISPEIAETKVVVLTELEI